ncbi:MAG: formylglycine-generating enzyme family protein [Thiofilum sp.]|uniref:formylglycine-generating enzyme family protein n=1 Tax=Thiofilum sp. TaxID=2212733 RepID=UPI0025DF7666|nr:formylglycine-generating enzyme family protein [Thiofilum sp.]MBK8451934.1 formylglycine-generating enzyme family protein [Thiofilum sp.]
MQLGRGVFTHFLVQGLRGQAVEADGAISFESLTQYVQEETAQWTLQHLQKTQLPYAHAWSGSFGVFVLGQVGQRVAAPVPAPPPVERPTPAPTPPPVVRPTAAPAQARVIEPQMVNIPAGTFTMGCVAGRDDVVEGDCETNEKPARQVRVNAFQMGKTEVTVAQYMACVQAGGCNKPEWDSPNAPSGYATMGSALRGANYPIVGVSWNDAQAYVRWLSQQTGKRYRLPSEAEWEYAARAGGNTAYSWGSSIGKNRANCYGDQCGDSYQYTAPVVSYAANSYGLHNMHGNVWEWVADCYANYASAPSDSTVVASTNCSLRVLRGGSWFDIPQDLRSAYRSRFGPTNRYNSVGFRVAAG